MKYLLLILLLTFSAFACTGDCMACHPKLVPTINEDERHKPMLTCINCHPADPSSTAECGDKCFSCHSAAKIHAVKVKEHNIIQTCIDCHTTSKNKVFDTTETFDQSKKDSLRDFFIN